MPRAKKPRRLGPDKTRPNYINLTSEDDDAQVYRVFSLKYAVELFSTRRNTLVRPVLWDDPFENFVLNSIGSLSDGSRYRISFKDDLYGQCWSTVRDSDALWRIYSPDKTGVRLRSTIGQLFESLCRGVGGEFVRNSCFVGKVEYRSQEDIVEMLTDSDLMTGAVLDGTGRGQAASLMLKRKEFAHEREVRLVYFNHDPKFRADLFKYDVDPFLLFDEVTFDPRLDPEMIEVYSTYFKTIGYKGSINQSPLYRLPALQHRLRV